MWTGGIFGISEEIWFELWQLLGFLHEAGKIVGFFPLLGTFHCVCYPKLLRTIEVSLQKWVRTWGKRWFHFWLYFWVSLIMLIFYLQACGRAVIPPKTEIEVTLLESEEWESICKGKELQPESLMSKSGLMKVQCVFEAIQCWCHSTFLSSLSLSFPILISIKFISIISHVFSAVWARYSLFYLLHMWWKDAPLPFINVKIVCTYSYQFLLVNLPVLSIFYVPPFIFLCLLKTKILFSSKSKTNWRKEPSECQMSFASLRAASQPFVCLLCLDSKLFRGGAPFLCLYKCLAGWGPDRAGLLGGYHSAQ